MGTGLCRMSILVIVTVTIPQSFRIIICHRPNSNSGLFFCCLFCTLSMALFIYILFFLLHAFNVFFINLYFVVNLSNEWDFRWHFAYQITNVKKY